MRNAGNSQRGILPLILLLVVAFGLIALSQALLSGTLDFPSSGEPGVLPVQPEETDTDQPAQAVETLATATPSVELSPTPQLQPTDEHTPHSTRTLTLPSTHAGYDTLQRQRPPHPETAACYTCRLPLSKRPHAPPFPLITARNSAARSFT
jgi:hypothetical protein